MKPDIDPLDAFMANMEEDVREIFYVYNALEERLMNFFSLVDETGEGSEDRRYFEGQRGACFGSEKAESVRYRGQGEWPSYLTRDDFCEI